jgi:hypothetical protein
LDGRPLAELNLTEALADVLWHLDTGDTAASMRHLASLLNLIAWVRMTPVIKRMEAPEESTKLYTSIALPRSSVPER